MKQYSVYFKEPVTLTYIGDRFNHDTHRWEEGEITETSSHFTFYSVAPAKKLIKANIDKYKGSSITQIWANGDWENCGEIQLAGSNNTYMANTRQKKPNY